MKRLWWRILLFDSFCIRNGWHTTDR